MTWYPSWCSPRTARPASTSGESAWQQKASAASRGTTRPTSDPRYIWFRDQPFYEASEIRVIRLDP